VGSYIKKTSNPLNLGLSLAAGLGLTLMMIALGVGVTNDNAGAFVGGAFALGVVLLLIGVIGWAAVLRPFDHYDDIDVPQYTGHHHDSHEAHGAIIVAEGHDIEPHAENHS